LAVIEGLNIGLVRVFSNMGPVEEAPAMTGAAPDAGQHDAAEQPWWAKLIPMPSAPKEVDFSDPKEVRAPFAPSLPTSQCPCLYMRGRTQMVTTVVQASMVTTVV